MSTSFLTQKINTNAAIRGGRLPVSLHPWHIALTVSVHAERHRLYQALTLPEYMEAWIRLPRNHGHQEVSATCTSESYRIVGRDGYGSEVCIGGAYRVSRRSKIILTWKRGSASTASPSLVTIRLLGDFARTTLYLVHSGLASKAEYAWHREFWEGSLGRLCCLF
jgi:uncharacterized protein YndB with AHSA1/START domain